VLLYRCYTGGRLRPGRDQPAHPQADRRGARPRRQGQPRQQRAFRRRSGRSLRRPRSWTSEAPGPRQGPAASGWRVRWASSPTAPAWP
jgi:hypothetical protein